MKLFLPYLLFVFLFCFEVQGGISEIQRKIEDIDRGIEESISTVEQLREEERNVIAKLVEIEKQLKVAQAEFREIEQEYNRVNRRITLGEKSIEIINEELIEKEKRLKEILLLWYKSEDNLLYDYILKGENLLDLLDRNDNIKRLLQFYEDTIKKVTDIRFEVEIEKEMVTEERRNLTNLRARLNSKRRDLERNITQRNRMLNELKDKTHYYTQRIEELKVEKIEAQKEIERIIRSQRVEETDLEVQQIIDRLGYFQYPSDGIVRYGYNEKKYISGDNFIETTGIEIAGNIGDRINAAADGRVLYSDNFESLGYVIIVDHGYGIVSVYGNLISGYKHRGDVVRKGETIGVLGIAPATGESLLYFELRLNTKTIDPVIFLKK